MDSLNLKELEILIRNNLDINISNHIANIKLSFEGSPSYLVAYLYPLDLFFPMELFPKNTWNKDGFYLEIDEDFLPIGISLESILISNSKMLDMQNAEKACIEYATLINSYYTD